jgi:hypothetical protein
MFSCNRLYKSYQLMKGINKTENNHIAQIKIKEGVII